MVEYNLAILHFSDPGDDGPGRISILDEPRLTLRQFEEILRASEVARDVMSGGLLAFARQARANYDAFLTQVERQIDSTGEADASYFHRGQWEIAGVGAALSVAAGAHMFQEQTESAASRATGSKDRVHEIFRRVYDSNPAHYAVYRLRNLLVHYSMRCVSLDIVADRSPRPSLHLDLEVAYKATAGFNRQVRAYLDERGPKPDLAPMFDEAIASLRDIWLRTVRLTNPTVDDDFAALRELEPQFRGIEGARAIAKETAGKSLGVPGHSFHLLTRDLFGFADGWAIGPPPDRPNTAQETWAEFDSRQENNKRLGEDE